MIRIVIFGNSGSGKSTLASCYATIPGVGYLDLDTIAWDTPGVRKETAESIEELHTFMRDRESWVIEGCYGSLIAEAAKTATEIIFLNPGIEECRKNCRARPWEPHKYESREAQDANLEMLLQWVAEYETRTDEFSLPAHRQIFESFGGKKQELKSNLETQNKAMKATASNRSSP